MTEHVAIGITAMAGKGLTSTRRETPLPAVQTMGVATKANTASGMLTLADNTVIVTLS
jgi:hypothetical protein